MGQDGKTPPTGRELFRNRSAFITVGRKNNPERLTKFLDRLMKFPNVTQACAFTGFSYSTLRYYLAKSETGKSGDGLDLTYGEETKRFHQHYSDVRDAAVQMVEDEFFKRAINGYYEVLHDKGRVQYQIDPELSNLGLTGPDAYLLDEDGRPIPERIEHQDPEVMLNVLRAYRRDRYGRHEQVDVSVRGGVLVVGVAKTSKELEATYGNVTHSDIEDVEFEELPAKDGADE